MMRIPCPWCGDCDENEFSYGGPSAAARPSLGCTNETWGRYLYYRANVKGASHERWRHAYGCGQWFSMVRDSVTHQVLETSRLGKTSP